MYTQKALGELELTVKLPQRPALRIHRLGDSPAAPQRAMRKQRSGRQLGGNRGR
jgi:hypothetical protein